MMKKFLLPTLLLLTFSNSLFAASFEEGKEAYYSQDYEKAFSILEPMAAKGHAKAQITLGIMYDFGHGVEKDPVKAISWYEKAAAQGNSSVQHDLGVKYFKGQGVEQDYDKASAWWRMAADNGVAVSQYNLGIMYARGLGIEKDSAQAVNWYSKAASQGHPHAQYSLGVMYSFGQGVTQDYTKGLSYFQDAAEQNIAQAQYNLAVLLEHGRGTDVDLVGARKWYQRASEGGIEQATERLQSFEDSSESVQVTSIETPPAVPAEAITTEKTEPRKSASKEDPVTNVTTNTQTASTTETEALVIPETTITKNDPARNPAPTKLPPENHQVVSGEEIEKATAALQQQAEVVKIVEKPVQAPAKKIAKKIKTPKPAKQLPKTNSDNNDTDLKVSNESVVHFSQESLDENWIVAQNPGHYALQMIAFHQKEYAQRYIDNLDLEGEKAVYKSTMHGRTIYKVIYGNFLNHKESLRGRRALPPKYRDARPFPRSFEFIQNDIKE
ncbi:MAG: SPOR domain-containing protein [Gammaproteobacteria bacterium]